MKKISYFAILFSFLIAGHALAFSDVRSSDWFYSAVNSGVQAGYLDNTKVNFSPNDSLLRAEAVKIVALAFDLNESGVNNFSDVPKNSWYEKYLISLVKKNLINGYADFRGRPLNLFKPEGKVTWAEAAKILVSLLPESIDSGACNFANLSPQVWYYPAICKLSVLGILHPSGLDDNSFVTRAQFVQMVNSTLQVKNNLKIPTVSNQSNTNSNTQPTVSGELENSHVEFITGNGLKLTGRLYKPAGNGPFKTVVALHGCTGLLTNNGEIGSEFIEWGDFLKNQQTVTLFVDSFTARGLSNVCSTDLLDEDVDRVKDAYAAKDYLKTLDYVDSNKMFLVGWSNGASTVVSALGKQNNPVDIASRGQFQAGFAEYPGCGLNSHYGTDYSKISNLSKGTYLPYAPLTIFAAQNDQTTPPQPKCDNLVERARQLGSSAASGNVINYSILTGAIHGFDRAKSGSLDWTDADVTAKNTARKAILESIGSY